MSFITSLSRISHGACLVLMKTFHQNDEMVDVNYLNGGCEWTWNGGCGIGRNLGDYMFMNIGISFCAIF